MGSRSGVTSHLDRRRSNHHVSCAWLVRKTALGAHHAYIIYSALLLRGFKSSDRVQMACSTYHSCCTNLTPYNYKPKAGSVREVRYGYKQSGLCRYRGVYGSECKTQFTQISVIIKRVNASASDLSAEFFSESVSRKQIQESKVWGSAHMLSFLTYFCVDRLYYIVQYLLLLIRDAWNHALVIGAGVPGAGHKELRASRHALE